MGVKEAGKMFLIRRTLSLNRGMYDKEMRYISEYWRSKWTEQAVSSLRLGYQVPRKNQRRVTDPQKPNILAARKHMLLRIM